MKAKVKAPPNVYPVKADEAKDPIGSDPLRAGHERCSTGGGLAVGAWAAAAREISADPGYEPGSRFCERTVTGDGPSVTQPERAGILQGSLR